VIFSSPALPSSHLAATTPDCISTTNRPTKTGVPTLLTFLLGTNALPSTLFQQIRSCAHGISEQHPRLHPSTMSPIADRAVLDSPLFKLPPELRDIIYEYTVGSDPKMTYEEDDKRPPAIKLFASYNVQEPPLLHVCRTIRREALGFFLARPPYKVAVYVRRFREVSLDFWEHEASSIFSKSNSEREKVTSTLHYPHDAVWADVTRWLRDAEEVLNRRGDDTRVARLINVLTAMYDPLLMTVACGIIPVERRKTIDFGPVSLFPFHFQCRAVVTT
jgi:hypothetical protein